MKARILLLVCSLLLLLCSANAQSSYLNVARPAEDKYAAVLQKSFIWLQTAGTTSQHYVAFRKVVNIEEQIREATLRVFADNRFIIWINGRYVNRGPARFDPKGPQYDILDVKSHLRKGQNAIAILVHHYAVGNYTEWFDQNARMMAHVPGLTAMLNINLNSDENLSLVTDESWKANKNTMYQASPGSYSSVPDNIDARLSDGDWSVIEYNDERWEPATKINGNKWGKLTPRFIPLLREQTLIPERVIQHRNAAETDNTVKQLHKVLPLKMKGGSELVIDIGKTRQAYSTLEFDAEEGSLIEIEYATLFHQNKKVAKMVSFIKHPGNRYICRKGFQRYMSGDSFGFKYLVIKVISGDIRLQSVSVTERSYPFERHGSFISNDTVLNNIWNTCVNTVEACSEDAFVDCADRERAQWIADGYKMSYPVSRIALATREINGDLKYGDGRLVRKMIRDMSFSQLKDGRLQPMRPSVYPVTGTHGVIDDYSCLWVQAAVEYYQRSGDIDFIKQVWPNMQSVMDYFLRRRTSDGLINAREFIYFDNPLKYVQCEGATINSFIYGSLREIARMAKIIGDLKSFEKYNSAADALFTTFNRSLWNENEGSYNAANFSEEGASLVDTPASFTLKYEKPFDFGRTVAPNYHAALMALYYNLVPPERHERVLRFMLNGSVEKDVWWPYTSRYFLDVLYRQERAGLSLLALNYMRKKFEHMTKYEMGTTSEGWYGGSFVHESSSHPAYFLSAFVLGVRSEITDDGLRLIIKPDLGDLKKAEGTVLSEFGNTDVKWERAGDGKSLRFMVNVPRGATGLLYIPALAANPDMTVDGKTLVSRGRVKRGVKHVNGYYVIEVFEGTHQGTVRGE